jgi:Ni/Co efflux regulator RcnB
MKTSKASSLLLVAAMCLSQGGVWAQNYRGNGNSRDEGRQNDRGQNNNHQDNRNGDKHDRRDGVGRGAGPDHAFYRGERLPADYRSRHYVVEDWRGHGLHSPPRGYHWVQTGGDYVLVAITTGIILELLLNQ